MLRDRNTSLRLIKHRKCLYRQAEVVDGRMTELVYLELRDIFKTAEIRILFKLCVYEQLLLMII